MPDCHLRVLHVKQGTEPTKICSTAEHLLYLYLELAQQVETLIDPLPTSWAQAAGYYNLQSALQAETLKDRPRKFRVRAANNNFNPRFQLLREDKARHKVQLPDTSNISLLATPCFLQWC